MYNTNMTPERKESPTDFFERLTAWLKSTGASFRVIEHEPIDGTASGSSTTSGTRPEQGAKTLIMMIDGEKPIMVVLRGTDRVNYKAIRGVTNSQDVRLASAEEVAGVTPLAIGTLPPFGDLFGLTTYVDRQLLAQSEIACGTGLTTKTLLVNTKDFERIASPLVGDFIKQ